MAETEPAITSVEPIESVSESPVAPLPRLRFLDLVLDKLDALRFSVSDCLDAMARCNPPHEGNEMP